MSVLRYISCFTLSLILIFQASFPGVLALGDEGIAINSIEDLQGDHKNERVDTVSSIVDDSEVVIPHNEISKLIAANALFTQQSPLSDIIEPQFIVNPITESIYIGTGGVLVGVDNVMQIPSVPFVDGKKSKKIQLNHSAYNKKRVSGTRGMIGIQISTGTIISSASGDVIDPKNIMISDVSSLTHNKADVFHNKKNKKLRSKKGNPNTIIQSDVFEFGIPGTHLIFSNPVAITIETPNISDGTMVDLGVLHAGDINFNTSGLSVSSDTLCNADGSASKVGSQVMVKSGKITFYSCGASSFTLNPTGGTAGSNDLRLIVGDCAQVQIYYNNLSQIYTGNPPATGCTGPSVWPVLRVGTINYGNTFTAWTTATTTGSTNGNTFTATSTMTAVTGGRTYTLIIDWSHTAPNKYLTWSYRVIVPTGNTQNVKFYYGMDSFVAGGDGNDTGYYTSTGGQTVGIYDSVANIISAFRYISGPTWAGYQANAYSTVRTQITNGANFSNLIQSTSGDLGFGINWNFGTAPATYTGSVEWRLLPYTTANVVDLIPGIGQPEGPLTTTYVSQLPIIITNAGNLTSTGIQTITLTLPTNISGPTSAFIDNGWSCGATVGTIVTCTKGANIAPLGTDTFYIPVIPLPAASGTNVTFNVSLNNPGDSNTTNNTAFITNAVVSGAPANDPGGVAGETLWLQANNGTNCTTTGCTISAWTNKGSIGTAANGVTGSGIVTYDPINRINSNPTLYFNNASLNTNNNLGLPTIAASIFAVTKISTGGQFLIGSQTVTTGAREWMTSPTIDQWKGYVGTVFYSGTNGKTSNIPAITTTIRQTAGSSIGYTNGLQVLSGANTTAFTASNIGIGRVANTHSTLTNLAEVIVYASGVTILQKNQIESYLGIKYGITINQTIPTNYTLSNSSIVWNATTAGLYNKNIAGIGRDDKSTLNQISSQSVDNTGDISVSKTLIATNYQTLTWANNGSAINTFSLTDAPSGYSRISRVWQFQEKNTDIGNVKIAYPVSSLPIGASSPIYMFVDADGVFSTGATAITGSLINNNWEFSINVSDMQYVTFGQLAGDTIAPTISSISLASGSLMPIGNFPLSIVYSDTGSNINPSSLTGTIYAWNGSNAWNSTNLAPTYMSISSATTTLGNFTLSGLPFGKYRFDLSIADNAGNITTQSVIYYIDAIEWSVSGDTYNIGDIVGGIQSFGTGEMIVTVKTVGAGYVLKLTGDNTLSVGSDTINYWNGITGWGYDLWNGFSYSGMITSHAPSATIATQLANINIHGLKNTYTYRIKYGGNIGMEQSAGIYNGSIGFSLVANY